MQWAFSVDERLFGKMKQMIDITCDLTGKPHDLAMQNLCMHVNEKVRFKTSYQNLKRIAAFDNTSQTLLLSI